MTALDFLCKVSNPHQSPGAAINLQKLIRNIDGRSRLTVKRNVSHDTLLSTNNKNRDAGANAGTTGERASPAIDGRFVRLYARVRCHAKFPRLRIFLQSYL